MVERNWKKYYTRDELEKKLDDQINLRADKLFKELRNKKNNSKINSKQVSYV